MTLPSHFVLLKYRFIISLRPPHYREQSSSFLTMNKITSSGRREERVEYLPLVVIPAKAGIQAVCKLLKTLDVPPAAGLRPASLCLLSPG
jgi:hypothetical protein